MRLLTNILKTTRGSEVNLLDSEDHNLFFKEDELISWIKEIVDFGIRRPGYEADIKCQEWIKTKFLEFNLSDIKEEPVELLIWEESGAKLTVWQNQEPTLTTEIPAFPVPFTTPTKNFIGELAPLDAIGEESSSTIAIGKLGLSTVPLNFFRSLAVDFYDPKDEFNYLQQTLPFGPEFTEVLTPAINKSVRAFIGILDGFPWETMEYYVPYDGIIKDITAVWISKKSGSRILSMMQNGTVSGSISVLGTNRMGKSENISATIYGKSDKWIIIGSHHDAPWASAVEDGSGIAMVLSLAKYYSQAEKPKHNILFLLTAGHMSGGAGTKTFIKDHPEIVKNLVLEIHLEHAANECTISDGKLLPTGMPECRWWFVTEDEHLLKAVKSALIAENLERSLIFKPDVFFEHPPTDGGFFHLENVPILNFLTAPMYLFDPEDTIDKVHLTSLGAVPRAVVQIVKSLEE